MEWLARAVNATVSRRVVLSAAASGLLATGCKPAADTTTPPLPVRAAGVYVFSGSLDGEAPPAGDGVLRTPHSTHWLESLALRTEVREPEAQQLGIPAFSVEPGQEIVIASFKVPGAPAYSGKTKATALVAAGKQTHPVDLFGAYDPVAEKYRVSDSQTVVACVPIGTQVELRATDAGRTVSLDLRTGKRGAGAALPSAYNAAPALGDDYQATGLLITQPRGKFEVDSGSYDLKVRIRSAAFGLTPWTPTRGWAPRGTTWAVLSGLAITAQTADSTGPKRNLLFVTAVLDLASTFQLTPAGGRRLAAPSARFKVPSIRTPNHSTDVPDLVWAVPDTFTRGVLRIAPHGSLTVDYANASVPAAWKQLPEAREFQVALKA
ncbi:hypothetical protein E1263_01460 [Kribbella antibiotica]|uniref:Uncharacterized protein n=1 Tax=Kribbella antibiotica TaxID=190195 RepID=A0A4R4ZXF8_9ACTN|nr:hypothetical protein [Kribbella antibiotica]TDD63004.1 hypothetical protein E1263_01460 [Kribbella antibiotica]